MSKDKTIEEKIAKQRAERAAQAKVQGKTSPENILDAINKKNQEKNSEINDDLESSYSIDSDDDLEPISPVVAAAEAQLKKEKEEKAKVIKETEKNTDSVDRPGIDLYKQFKDYKKDIIEDDIKTITDNFAKSLIKAKSAKNGEINLASMQTRLSTYIIDSSVLSGIKSDLDEFERQAGNNEELKKEIEELRQEISNDGIKAKLASYIADANAAQEFITAKIIENTIDKNSKLENPLQFSKDLAKHIKLSNVTGEKLNGLKHKNANAINLRINDFLSEDNTQKQNYESLGDIINKDLLVIYPALQSTNNKMIQGSQTVYKALEEKLAVIDIEFLETGDNAKKLSDTLAKSLKPGKKTINLEKKQIDQAFDEAFKIIEEDYNKFKTKTETKKVVDTQNTKTSDIPQEKSIKAIYNSEIDQIIDFGTKNLTQKQIDQIVSLPKKVFLDKELIIGEKQEILDNFERYYQSAVGLDNKADAYRLDDVSAIKLESAINPAIQTYINSVDKDKDLEQAISEFEIIEDFREFKKNAITQDFETDLDEYASKAPDSTYLQNEIINFRQETSKETDNNQKKEKTANEYQVQLDDFSTTINLNQLENANTEPKRENLSTKYTKNIVTLSKEIIQNSSLSTENRKSLLTNLNEYIETLPLELKDRVNDNLGIKAVAVLEVVKSGNDAEIAALRQDYIDDYLVQKATRTFEGLRRGNFSKIARPLALNAIANEGSVLFEASGTKKPNELAEVLSTINMGPELKKLETEITKMGISESAREEIDVVLTQMREFSTVGTNMVSTQGIAQEFLDREITRIIVESALTFGKVGDDSIIVTDRLIDYLDLDSELLNPKIFTNGVSNKTRPAKLENIIREASADILSKNGTDPKTLRAELDVDKMTDENLRILGDRINREAELEFKVISPVLKLIKKNNMYLTGQGIKSLRAEMQKQFKNVDAKFIDANAEVIIGKVNASVHRQYNKGVTGFFRNSFVKPLVDIVTNGMNKSNIEQIVTDVLKDDFGLEGVPSINKSYEKYIRDEYKVLEKQKKKELAQKQKSGNGKYNQVLEELKEKGSKVLKKTQQKKEVPQKTVIKEPAQKTKKRTGAVTDRPSEPDAKRQRTEQPSVNKVSKSVQKSVVPSAKVQKGFDKPVDGAYSSNVDIAESRANFLISQMNIMKFTIEAMRDSDIAPEIEKLGSKFTKGEIEDESLMQALADPKKREIISKIMESAVFEGKIPERMAMIEEDMHKNRDIVKCCVWHN